MIKKVSRNEMRKVRHTRIRENLSGTSERPRLCVFRSNANIEAQIIDDVKGVTLVSASSLEKELNLKNGGNVEAAKVIGAEIRQFALKLAQTPRPGQLSLRVVIVRHKTASPRHKLRKTGVSRSLVNPSLCVEKGVLLKIGTGFSRFDGCESARSPIHRIGCSTDYPHVPSP